MPIFLIRPKEGKDSRRYDSFGGFVICEADEDEVRQIAQSHIADEKLDATDFWLNPELTEVIDLANWKSDGIILSDFRAG